MNEGVADGLTWVRELGTTMGDRFGDTAFVGFKPELNDVSEQQLWDASPYAHTLLISFNNGEKYMPDADSHAWGPTGSAEAQKPPHVAGAAEQLRDTALGLLDNLK